MAEAEAAREGARGAAREALGALERVALEARSTPLLEAQ